MAEKTSVVARNLALVALEALNLEAGPHTESRTSLTLAIEDAAGELDIDPDEATIQEAVELLLERARKGHW